ncbi:MAG: hypothetical protein M1821_009014 [Bathelium mastoideum]|nr:MAG: hypothetical protein M1821_009014 [Bathelium mastoideum]
MKRTQSDTGLVSEALLLRSYDNTKRGWSQEQQSRTKEGSRQQTSRTGTGTGTSGSGIKWVSTQPNTVKSPSSEAHKWPIWKVALAATAAPFYFGSFKANAETNGVQGVEYADGGLHGNNNPTTEGIAEIDSLSPLGTIVSIGTSRGNTRSVMSFRKKIQDHFNEGSDPELVHEAVSDEMWKRRKPYYRLNNPRALKMDLDEWKPRGPFTKKPGSHTLRTIRESFNEWIKLPENYEKFQGCAKDLVHRRRERSNDDAKWEHFANGTRYWCQSKECDATAFINRDEFLKHFRRVHENTAPLREAQKEQIIREWSRSFQWEYRKAPRS